MESPLFSYLIFMESKTVKGIIMNKNVANNDSHVTVQTVLKLNEQSLK